MISIRHSTATRANEHLKEAAAKEGETNRAWLSRIKATGGLLLLGGSSIAHFRIRVAQSHLRNDLSPSFWSIVGLLDGESAFYSVPLDLREEASDVPRNNGIVRCSMKEYDDPERFPNIALIHFSGDHAIPNIIEQVKGQRSVVDLPSLILPWLGYVWGAGSRGNPLLEGQGLPSAAFAETVYGIAGVELTPGLSSASSCPEAIWQSAKWWREYYEETAQRRPATEGGPAVPKGDYLIRQQAAAPMAQVKTPGKRRGK
ncbi:MAG: hypothetical protein WAO55_06880 [Candidatus Manganitrophaceae bacterium]